MGGMLSSTTKYSGSNSAEWKGDIGNEKSTGFGAELMHMGRNIGIGTGLHYSTYAAEVYRSGIENVSRGQWEAAKAVNLSTRQTWVHIILPQAIPPMIPALANYLIAMFKETPLLSAITVLELMNQAKSVANSSYRYIEPMTMVGVFFLIMSLISVVFLRWLEERYARVEER